MRHAIKLCGTAGRHERVVCSLVTATFDLNFLASQNVGKQTRTACGGLSNGDGPLRRFPFCRFPLPNLHANP